MVVTDVKMKFILHNGSASTIQSIHILENKRPEIKKKLRKKEKNTVKNTQQNNFHQQYCINKTISNIVLHVIWSRLTNNHITMMHCVTLFM